MQIIRRKDCYGLLCFVQFQLSIRQGLRWCIKLGPLEVQFSKWFYSVKKGVLNLFLSMAYNVISCRQVAGDIQILKIANLLKKSDSRPQKSPKIPQKSLHSIAICSIFNRYGIFWMIPGESSCPDGSEYVWQEYVFAMIDFTAKRSTFAYVSMSYIFGKLWHSAIIQAIWKPFKLNTLKML